MQKFVILSGCSGGGKSTLLEELKRQGYSVVEEAGRKIVKEHGDLELQVLCEMIIAKSLEAYQQAKTMTKVKDGIIFFDRSFLEGINYFLSINMPKYDYLIDEFRYYPVVYMTPPWKEIYVQDKERKHTIDDGVKEYNQLITFYPSCGYEIVVLPKVSVQERVEFVLAELKSI